ncbi:MAG: mucoidy inhibitor MuiA family protein [Sedimentisphaerales bacterium]|nr:mucoidy inhibitor MuiA family protein [Sedimentisphaerales bacterium]
MRNHRQTILLVVALTGILISVSFADTTTTGTISKVTVYRGQALVTRTIGIHLPAGTSELIVQNLPAMIVSESIYAQTSDSAKVLSVRYREKAVREDTREEVKQLDTQIEAVQNKLKYAKEQLDLNAQQWKMYENLKDFTVTAERTDLNKGVLVYEPVQNLTELIEQKGTEYLERKLELEDEMSESQKELDLLERKRNELVAGQSRTEREAILFINSADSKKGTIELSYLVNGANWQQQYNLRANPQKSNVLIEYNAIVNQTSGEDWDNVALWLSTAEPTMVAAAPILEPMLVGLSNRAQIQQALQPPMLQSDQIRQFQKSRKDYIKQGIAANTELNELAIQNQTLFFNVSQREAQEFQEKFAEISRTEGVSVTYELPGQLTLPSRSDQQLVSIASITTKADFTLVATPLLTDYVYLQADLLNGSDTLLLPGPASIFRNGEFVGKSQLPQVTIGETFTAGFGIDSQVRVVRELENKKTHIQGGNQIDTYDYRIALSNYKNTPVELQLLDRLPYTENSSIKIELGQTEPSLCQDSEYLRTARKKGILRWDLNLAPNSGETNVTIVKYSFTMEYDRNMQIQPRHSAQQ